MLGQLGGPPGSPGPAPPWLPRYWPKPAFLRSRDQGASTHIKNSKFKPIPTHFIHHFTFFSLFCPQKLPKSGHFSKKSYICTRIRPRDPSQMKDLLILRRIHLSKAPATFIRPTWWQKKVKNLKNGVSQTVFPLFSYQDGFLATWDPSQMKDLKILHQIHLTRALYDEIWPVSSRFYGTYLLFRSMFRSNAYFLQLLKAETLIFGKSAKFRTWYT